MTTRAVLASAMRATMLGWTLLFSGAESNATESISPGDGDRNVSVDAGVRFRLTQPLSPQALEQGLAQVVLFRLEAGMPVEPVEGKISFEGATNTLAFKPARALRPGAEYLVTAVVIRDLMRGESIQRQWRFRTVAGPELQAGRTAGGSDKSSAPTPAPRALETPTEAGTAESPEAVIERTAREFERWPDYEPFRVQTLDAIVHDESARPATRSRAAVLAGWICTKHPQYLRKAEEFFRLALKHDRQSWQAEWGLGSVLRTQKRFELSNDALRRAVGINPGLFEAYHCESRNHEDLGNATEAERAFARAVEAAPDKSVAYATFAAAADREGAIAKAIAHFSRATELAPENAELWWRYGLYCREHRRHLTAARAVGKAAALGPATAQQWLILAELHARNMKLDPAIDAVRRALDIAPKEPAAWRQLRLIGQAWNVKRKGDEIERVLTEEQSKRGECPASLSEIGFQVALGASSVARPGAGGAQTSQERYRSAARNFLRAWDLDPDREVVFPALFELGRIVGADFARLEEAMLGLDPARVEIMTLTDELRRRQAQAAQAKLREKRLWERLGSSSYDRTAAGLSYVDPEVEDVMRDWRLQTSGMFGAVGLVWRPAP